MNNRTNISSQKLTWLLYGALAFSQLSIIFVFDKILYKGDIEAVESVALTFGALAFVIALISHLVYMKATSISVSEDDLLALPDYQKASKDNDFAQKTIIRENNEAARKYVFYILSWALGEIVIILGVSGYFMGMIKPYNYYFFAVGIALHILHMPKSRPKEI